MKPLDALSDALHSLKSNILRSILTTLGIIIGVSAVIIMVAVGNGAKARVQQLIQSLGSNVMMVRPGSSVGGGVHGGEGSLPTLTEDDAAALAREVPGVAEAAPFVRGGVQAIAGNQNWATAAYGVNPDYLVAREWPITVGRGFEPGEVKGAAKVALLGSTVVKSLFQNENPLGQIIRVQKVPFQVIGVLGSKGQTPFGTDQDDVIMIPLSTAKRRVLGGRELGGHIVDGIMLKARSAAEVTAVETQAKELLRQRHNLRPSEDDDFRLRNLAEMLNTQASSSQAMGLLLMAVASVSLVVGGIGIMNIMLVSVTERTREIGLRMAVGAEGRDILAQFLMESVVLSLIGGLIGAILGVGGALIIAQVSQWPAIIDPASVLMSFLFSAAVGIFFGFYPARKASRLDPIAALRYE
ncbi:MAG: ABC transporter permease [Deltaproteobacteria bacterium]|nr:ABC transporter permease [Deltaproteobacteria bacterium]